MVVLLSLMLPDDFAHKVKHSKNKKIDLIFY